MTNDKSWRERTRVTYVTLTVLLIALYAVKFCLLIPLLKEDYDGYAALETSYMVLCGVPSLISAAVTAILDIKIFRRLTKKTFILYCVTEIAVALELAPPLLFWCGAISSISALTGAIMTVIDHASYGERTAKAKRIEAARLAAQNGGSRGLKSGSGKKNRKKGGGV